MDLSGVVHCVMADTPSLVMPSWGCAVTEAMPWATLPLTRLIGARSGQVAGGEKRASPPGPEQAPTRSNRASQSSPDVDVTIATAVAEAGSAPSCPRRASRFCLNSCSFASPASLSCCLGCMTAWQKLYEQMFRSSRNHRPSALNHLGPHHSSHTHFPAPPSQLRGLNSTLSTQERASGPRGPPGHGRF